MLKFKDFANTQEYQQADPAARLEMRRAYFDTQIRPRIPARHVDTQWQQFDQATGELGNPTQGYGGDLLDATQQGFYGGIADLASGVDYLAGGDGENAVADYFRGKADEQWQDMSPAGREAMQGFGVEEKPDSFTGYGLTDTSTKGGFGLQLASAAGSFGPSIIPGGLLARVLGWGAKGKRAYDLADKTKKIKTVDDARRVKKLSDRIDQTAFATGYGVTGGAMIGGGAVEQTKQLVLNSGYEDLKDLPRFQALYRQEYEAAGGGDTRAPFERARGLLAAEAAEEAFAPAAGVGALSMGVAGPLLDKVGRGMGATTRPGNAAKGTVVEGTQEFTEGAGQQIASNLGQQSIGMEVDTTQGAMAQGLSGAIVGGPVGAVVGGVPTPQGRPDQTQLQQGLTDLHSQRQTLQEQMSRPDADSVTLTGLLRDNAIAIAEAEALLQSHQRIESRQPIESRESAPMDEAVDLPPEVQPQTPLALEHQPEPFYTDSQGNTGSDLQQLRTESTRQQHPDYPQYTGDEESDLQTYTGRVSGLKKILRDFQWKPEDKAQRQQLRKIVDERRKLEKQSRELAAKQKQLPGTGGIPQSAGSATGTNDATNPALKGERERRQQPQPYTPVNIIEKLQAAKVAYDSNRVEDFNQAVAEIHAANMAEREKLQTAEYELSGKGVDSRSKNPAYREYMGAVADDVTQNQIQDKRASLKLQDDDSLIPAIGKLGGLDLASVEGGVAESMDAHIKSNRLGLKGKYLKKSRGITLDDMGRRLAEVGYTVNGREMTGHEVSDAIEAEIAGRPFFSDARSDYGDLYRDELQGAAGASNRTAPAIRAALNGEPLSGEQRNELARVLESAEVDPHFDRPDYLSQEEAAIDQARQDNALTDDWYDRYEPEALSYADNETELNGEAFSGTDWKEINEQRLLDDAATHEQELNYEERPDDNRRAGQSLRQSSQRMGEENRQERPESEKQSRGLSRQEAEKELTPSETPATDNEPSDAQKEAGNYKKEHVKIHGLDISLENLKGSTRSGTDPDGNDWSVKMQHHYGYIKRTEGADGDQVDVFVGDNQDSEKVFIVDQVNKDGSFDEHKVMLGFNTRRSAIAGYKSNYDKGWPVGEVTELSIEDFKQWLKTGDTRKPVAKQKPEKKSSQKKSEKNDIKKSEKKLNKKNAEKIEDFGEKIGGARKDLWQSFHDALTSDVDVAALPLSKSFPEPDYVKLAEAGANRKALAVIAALRGEIPSKPRKSWKLKTWAENVEAARRIAELLVSGKMDVDKVLELMNTPEYQFGTIVRTVEVLAKVDPVHLKAAGKYRISAGSFSLFNGEKRNPGVPLYYLSEANGRRTIYSVSSENLDELIQPALDYINKQVTQEKSTGRQTRFDVFSTRGEKNYWVGKKLGPGKFIELKSGFTVVGEARAFIENNQQWLEDELKKKKDVPAHRRETNNERTGEDYRKGKDITPEDFSKAFGFRGVEFGNWVEQDRRQHDLNRAYDALHDLANLINVPTQALSLNGELGLAFGARGKGGKRPAAAHYEPGKVVINLTKNNGPGSLAHEWWHSLDNYFSRTGGDRSGFFSEFPSTLNGDVRQELATAFKDVTKAIRKTGLPDRSGKLDNTRSKNYWSTMLEMTARTFEHYVIHKLDASGYQNDYLANITDESVYEVLGESDRYPYLSNNELETVAKTFDDLFKTIKHRTTDKGVQLYRYRTTPAKGLKRDPLRLKLAPLEKKLGVPVQVLQSESQLPLDLYRDVRRHKAEGRVRGLYDPKTAQAFVVADNLDSVEDAARTVLHEVVGHHGVRQVAGKRLDTLLDQVYRDMSEGLKKALQKRYRRQLQGKTLHLQQRIIAEEYLAHLAERNPKNTWVQKVVSIIRNALRRLFPSIQWRPEDAVELLAAGRRRLKQNHKGVTDRDPRYRDSGQADPFYSAVERAAAAVKQEKAPGKSWLNAIKKMPHVTDEEIQWMGLDLFLNHQKGSVTRDQVLDYIRANRIEVKEVKYGSSDEDRDQAEKTYREQWIKDATEDMDFSQTNDYVHLGAWDDLLDEHRNKLWESNRDYYEESLREELEAGTHEDQNDYMDEDGNINDDAVFQYAAEQANFYNEDLSNEEVFKSIPEEERQSYAEELYDQYGFDEFESQYLDKHETRHKSYSTDGGDDYQELLFTLPDNEIWYPRQADASGAYDISPADLEHLKAGKIPEKLALSEKAGRWQADILIRSDDSPQAAVMGRQTLTDGHDSREDAIATVIEKYQKPYQKPQHPFYNRHHWDEANVLAFTRFQTFYDSDNNKVLLIDEVQSDWHQQGRETGYQSPEQKQAMEKEYDRIDNERKKIVRKELEKLKGKTFKYEPIWTPTQTKEVKIKDALDGWLNSELPTNTLQEKIREQAIQAIHQLNPHTQLDFLTSDLNAMSEKLRDYDNRPSDAPLKQNWPNMVMKRMLRHAAENGFDKVAWTTGGQQVMRYGSGQHLKAIEISPLLSLDGQEISEYSLTIKTHDGQEVNKVIEADYLEDSIGNRLAGEIRQKKQEHLSALIGTVPRFDLEEDKGHFQVYVGSDGSIIEGSPAEVERDLLEIRKDYARDAVVIKKDNLDEVVGGDGMAAFYDNRLVNYIKKYTKKWGGKVGKTELDTSGDSQVFWSVPVTDKMKESVLKDGQPLFALKDKNRSDDNTRYALKSDLPDEVEAVMNAIHGGIGKRRKGWGDRVKNWLKEHPAVGTKKGWKQGILDSFHSIAEMERDANEGNLMEAAQSAWKAALRTKNLEGVMTAVLGKGTPRLDNGSVVFRENSKGFLDVFEPVAEKGEIELWETWAASKRAMRLLKEGRENLYTPQRIKTIQTYVASMPGMEQRFQKVFDDYQALNSQVLDFAVQAGLIDKEARKLWDTGDYIPFHRVHEVAEGEGEQMRLFRKSGLSGQKSGIKQLTGGVEKISPLEAMFRNTQSLIDASFKNIAMQRIAKLGEETGAMEKTNASVRLSAEDVKAKLKELEVDTNALSPEALKRWQKLLVKFTDLGEGTVTVSEDGQTSSYQVNDPLLLAAITDLGTQNIHWMLKLLSIPKQVLTQLVTADPGFMVRNLFRDTLSTWMTVHPEINGKALKINPVSAAIRTFNKKIDKDDTRWSLMMAGGGSGGFYDIQPDNIRNKLSPEEQKRIINKPGQLWDAWQKFGSRFENANRLHVFEQVIKQGGSVAEAAHQAQDVLNFTRKGQWQIMNILVQSLPFFNARVQGLDRLWRGAKADGKSGWAGIAPSFLLRGAAYMSASLGLLALYDDDERYTSLPEWDKLNYHHVWFDDVHYRIPKPFEVGAIFGTLPEMIWQTSMGHEDLKWAQKMAGGMIFQTLAFDPVPQVARPAMDIAINESSFTGSPIIPLGLQYVKPEAQYDPWTSETMKQLVKAVPEGAPDWMRSPKKLQYLLQGYFGTIGRYALAATDVGTRMTVDAPARPALRVRNLPVAGSFIRDGVDATRYRSEMYEMQKELNDLVMTMNRYRDNGQRDKARELKEENREKLLARRGLNRYATRISRLRKQIRKIMDNRVMTAKVKRQRIDELSRRVNELSAEAVGRYSKRF